MKPSILSYPVFAYSMGRSAVYFTEYQLMNRLLALLPGAKPALRPEDPQVQKKLLSSLTELLKQDAQLIASGQVPWTVLTPESPKTHLRRMGRILWDGVGVYRRRKSGKTQEFGHRIRSKLDDVPRYFRRNFHYQTDGYLSEKSAQIYDHQVEMLFSGASHAMRRLVIGPLIEHLKGIERPKILEIAAGAGSATLSIRQALPNARITVTDLSGPYLKVAREQLKKFDGLDFLEADGTDLPFKDRQFDAVVSVFLFHELPLAERKKVIQESLRVLKPGGFLGAVDSIQLGDVPEFDPALELFPKNYHEPFFRDYLQHPLEDLTAEFGLRSIQSKSGFFSKVVYGEKSPLPRSGS